MKYAVTYNSPTYELVGSSTVFDTYAEAKAKAEEKLNELIADFDDKVIDEIDTFRDDAELGMYLTVVSGSVGGEMVEHWLQVTPIDHNEPGDGLKEESWRVHPDIVDDVTEYIRSRHEELEVEDPN